MKKRKNVNSRSPNQRISLFFFLIWATVLSFLLPRVSWAANKTVCNSGCDYTTIAAALTAVGSGNHTITVQAPYSANENVIISTSGVSATAPLTITVRTGDSVTVQSFAITGNYVTVNGFQITYSNAGAFGIEVTGSYVTISNNRINYTATSAGGNDPIAVLIGYPPTYPTGVTVSGNYVTGKYIHNAFRCYATNSLFENNEVEGIGGDFAYIWGHDNTFRSNYYHGVVDNGTGVHPDFFQTYGDGEPSYNIVIERNLGIDQGFCQPCNLSIDGQSNVHDWVFRDNVFVNFAGACNVGIPNVSFYNNTFYNCNTVNNDHCIGFFEGTPSSGFYGPGGIVKNNIFIGSTRNNAGWYSGSGQSVPTADYNYVAGLPPGFAAKTGFSEAHGINGGDPKFANLAAWDFHLQQGSPAIDKGVALSGFNYDRDGVSKPQGSAWDIGAYEYVSDGGGSGPPSSPKNLRMR